MKTLHILTHPPQDVEQAMIETLAGDGGEVARFDLGAAPVDYDQLIKLIFEADRVYCW